MTVSEALAKRKSIRAFKPEAVEKSLITEILEKAARTPSWANSQPWEVFVASGDTLARIRKAYVENYKNAVKISTEIPRPAEWTEAAKERTRGLRPDMVRDCGEEADRFGELNQNMFYAPCVLFLCIDKLLEHWALYDVGAYSQSVMLLATEYGLGTIPAITSVQYPEVLRKELKLPDNLKIAIGIPLGYIDDACQINNFNSARSPLSQSASFCD